ncbi:MAG: DUF58 domain-containing protein [Phycisphaerales bacterium]|jgi:uncharacterized protein (DUF58 family)
MVAPATNSGPIARVVARRYHMHFPGVVYLFITVVLLLGAIRSQNNLLFWLFGLAVGGLIVSGVLSAASLMGLSISRLCPDSAVAGQPLRLIYRLRTSNWFLPALGLTIEELPGRGERLANWPTFTQSITTFLARAAKTPTPVFSTFTPTHRGMLTFRLVRVWTTFPFGLAKKSVTFLLPAQVLVRPAPASVPHTLFAFSAGRSQSRQSLKRDRTGEEFFAIREHHPGDSIRTIAWRPSARLDRLVVRDSARTPERRVWLKINPDGGDIEPLLSLAAGAALSLSSAGFAVGLMGPNSAILESATGGLGAESTLLDTLALWDNALTPKPGHIHPADSILSISHTAPHSLTPHSPGVTMPSLEGNA